MYPSYRINMKGSVIEGFQFIDKVSFTSGSNSFLDVSFLITLLHRNSVHDCIDIPPPHMEVNGTPEHILQNIFLCVQQNKDIHTGLELLEGE